MVKDPTRDGIRFHIVAPEPSYHIIHRQVLNPEQTYHSYAYDIIPGQDKEGSYRVCIGASDSLF